MKKWIWGTSFALMLAVSPSIPFAADAADYTAKGNQLVQEKKYKEAIAQYQEALKKNPRDVRPKLFIGLCYAQIEDMDQALLYTKDASESLPSYAAFYNLGLIHAARKESEAAVSAFAQAEKISPESSEVKYQKGLAYASLKKYDQAILSYKKALALNPLLDKGRIALVGAFLSLNDRASAMAQVEELKKMKKDSLAKALEDRIEATPS